MFSAFRIQWNELVIILQYFARVSDQIAMANPGLGAAGALWISGAKLGTRGEDTSLIIFANSPLANFSTLVRLPFHDVRLHGGTRPHVAGKRMLDPLPSSFHFLILLNSSYADGFLESKGGMDGNLSKEFFSLRNE